MTAPQVEPQLIINALSEELQKSTSNRMYLMGLANQQAARIAELEVELAELKGESSEVTIGSNNNAD